MRRLFNFGVLALAGCGTDVSRFGISRYAKSYG